MRSGNDVYNALRGMGFSNVLLLDLGNDPIRQIVDSGIEYAFLALHGVNYEDGKLQGALEMLGIPYTGCGVLSSALCFHKERAKLVVKNLGVLTPEWFILNRISQIEQIPFVGPYIVKPPAQGSSIDVYKIDTATELENQIGVLLIEHGAILVEKYIPGRDLTIGIVGPTQQPNVLPILEIKTPTGIYDRQGKFGDDTEYIAPAPLSKDLEIEVKRLAAKIYTELRCKAVTRMDFRLDDSDLYFLEANTIPGMNSTTSNISHMLRASGLTYESFIQGIMEDSFCPS